MKKIMKKAHEMVREIKRQYPEVDYQAQLGLSLSYLLNKKEEKEMEKAKLKGSPKQVAWAEDIRRELLEGELPVSINKFSQPYRKKLADKVRAEGVEQSKMRERFLELVKEDFKKVVAKEERSTFYIDIEVGDFKLEPIIEEIS